MLIRMRWQIVVSVIGGALLSGQSLSVSNSFSWHPERYSLALPSTDLAVQLPSSQDFRYVLGIRVRENASPELIAGQLEQETMSGRRAPFRPVRGITDLPKSWIEKMPGRVTLKYERVGGDPVVVQITVRPGTRVQVNRGGSRVFEGAVAQDLVLKDDAVVEAANSSVAVLVNRAVFEGEPLASARPSIQATPRGYVATQSIAAKHWRDRGAIPAGSRRTDSSTPKCCPETAVLDLTIDEGGRVADVRVVSGGVTVREEARIWANQWRFEPFVVDDTPVRVMTRVIVTKFPSGTVKTSLDQ